MDFRLLVFSRTHFSPSSLELLFSPRLAEHRARSGRRRRPEGKQPFFSQPPLVFILSVLKHPPTNPPALLCHLSPFYSLPISFVHQKSSSSVHLCLFLHLFFFRFYLLFSFVRLLVSVPFLASTYMIHRFFSLSLHQLFQSSRISLCFRSTRIPLASLYLPMFSSPLLIRFYLPHFILSFCENISSYRADVICTTQRELVDILEVGRL